ncbi:MAG TPA: hypothetical protein VFQ61_01755 [Polyangiaceae bacterium]|nr:hypothetical protein [Polyangiaceae bacterium]
MSDGLGPEARALIEQALRDEGSVDSMELARIRRRVLASTLGAGVIGATGEAAALKAPAALLGAGSLVKAALVGTAAAVLAFGISYVWVPPPGASKVRPVAPPTAVTGARKVHATPASGPEEASSQSPSFSTTPSVIPESSVISAGGGEVPRPAERAPAVDLPHSNATSGHAQDSSGVRSPRAESPPLDPLANPAARSVGQTLPAGGSAPMSRGSVLQDSALAGPGMPTPAIQPPSLVDELTLLERVQNELRAGQGEQALRLLDQDRARAGDQLRAERLAAEVFASCQAGQLERARYAATRFLRQYPTTPAAARVRASCGGEHVVGRP